MGPEAEGGDEGDPGPERHQLFDGFGVVDGHDRFKGVGGKIFFQQISLDDLSCPGARFPSNEGNLSECTRSLFPDEGAPGRLFRVAKFSGNRHALDLLLDRGDLLGLRPATASLLLPVPSGRSRLISRDLSVPDILAHRLSSGEIPLCLKGLRRTGKLSQKGRTRQERREAFFSPHFSLDPGGFSGVPPRGVVIVDDLLVTGWTARAIVRLLALSGVEAGTIVTLLHRS